VDWTPLAQKHLADRKVILHADSANYRTKVSGVLHDAVVHCKKKRIIRGKVTWAAPQYVRVTTHKVAKGKILKVKSGTQHIDRAWRFLKKRVRRNQQVKAGTRQFVHAFEPRSMNTGFAATIFGCVQDTWPRST
jgi:hypothetical protein